MVISMVEPKSRANEGKSMRQSVFARHDDCYAALFSVSFAFAPDSLGTPVLLCRLCSANSKRPSQ